MKKQYIKNSTVLVTGGAGFIGSNLCEALLELNNKVVCLDNFSTGKMDNIAHLIANPNFKLRGGDIRNVEDCKKVCIGVDYVLHQAILSPASNENADLLTIHEVNVTGFLNIMSSAKEENVKGFLYNSSFSSIDEVGPDLLKLYSIVKETNQLYVDLFTNVYDFPITKLDYESILTQETILLNSEKFVSSDMYINKIVQLNIEAISSSLIEVPSIL